MDIKKREIDGFSLFCISDSLDNFSYPYSVVAVADKNSKSVFYELTVNNEINFKKYGLLLKKQDRGFIVYMSKYDFEERNDLIRVKNDDWSSQNTYFHSLGALRHLDIIPSISEATINAADISSLTEELNQQYGQNQELLLSLENIFSNVYYLYRFYGFTHTDDASLKKECENAIATTDKILASDDVIKFNFGSLKFATEKCIRSMYSNYCYHIVITPTLYNNLNEVSRQIVAMLKRLCYSFTDTNEYRDDLEVNIRDYKQSKKITEEHCGMITIRSLIFDTVDLDILSQLYLQPKSMSAPKSFLDYSVISDPFLLNKIEHLPSCKTRECEFSNEISRVLDGISYINFNLSERVHRAECSIRDSYAYIKLLVNLSIAIENGMNETFEALNNIIETHSQDEEMIEDLVNKIKREKRGNIMIILMIATISIIVLFKSIRYLLK